MSELQSRIDKLTAQAHEDLLDLLDRPLLEQLEAVAAEAWKYGPTGASVVCQSAADWIRRHLPAVLKEVSTDFKGQDVVALASAQDAMPQETLDGSPPIKAVAAMPPVWCRRKDGDASAIRADLVIDYGYVKGPASPDTWILLKGRVVVTIKTGDCPSLKLPIYKNLGRYCVIDANAAPVFIDADEFERDHERVEMPQDSSESTG